MADDLTSFVALSFYVQKLGPLHLVELMRQHHDPQEVLKVLKGLATEGLVDNVLKTCRAHAIDLVTIRNERYPALLHEIPDPPLTLYYKGRLPEDEPTLAIVGTRKPTEYGKQAAAAFAKGLASAGLLVVSGLAYGIDAVAHQATLEVGGRTIAVLPGGLDQVYPREHERLGSEIVGSGGALISEYPPGVPPAKYHFGVRNRIIAGLSLGTLIVEAAEHSGTLLTARSTLEYNRELFAVPHPIFSPMGIGPNRLIALGAKLVIEPNDILTELNLIPKEAGKQARGKPALPESSEEIALLDLLSGEPHHVDEIVKQSGLSVQKVQSCLMLMEMRQLVRNLGGNYYVRG